MLAIEEKLDRSPETVHYYHGLNLMQSLIWRWMQIGIISYVILFYTEMMVHIVMIAQVDQELLDLLRKQFRIVRMI